MSKSSYESLGASATKEGIHNALESAGISHDTGLFAVINDDLAGDPSYCSVVHCDGAGTKSLIAYLHFSETKDPSVFAGLSQDALVMNLDDVYCLGTPESMVLANAIARNAKIISDEAIGELIKSYKNLCTKLFELGVNVQLSGGETADMGDVVRSLVVDAVLTARMKRETLVNTRNIQAGDVIVGLSSTGQASYEEKPNSGIGSNGLTLARHALLSSHYRENFVESSVPNPDPNISYRGPFRTTDTPEGLGMSVGEALLSPTRTYSPILAKVFESLGSDVHGAIHVTGGALSKVLRFGPGGLKFIKDNLFATPALFSLIQEHGDVSWEEMYQVFNMGQRFELYVPENRAEEVISTSKAFNVDAQIIGRVENNNSSENIVEVKSQNGNFNYTL